MTDAPFLIVPFIQLSVLTGFHSWSTF